MFFSILKAFNPGQVRDRNGRWATTTGAAGTLAMEKNHRNYNVSQVVASALGNDKATIAKYHQAIEDINTDVKEGKMTSLIHSKNGDGTGGYTTDRLKLHLKIIDHVLGDISVVKPPKGKPPTLVILGGRGGSGKSNLDKENNKKFGVYSSKKSVVIDSDAIKEMLPEYDPAKAYLVHSESSHIADRVLAHVKKLGLNAVIDATLRTSSVPVVKRFNEAGFKTEAHFMHKSPLGALSGAVARWNTKTIVKNPITKTAKEFDYGRLVPPKVIESNTHNEANFDKLTKHVSRWSIVSNTALSGFEGKKIAQSIKKFLGFSDMLVASTPDCTVIPFVSILKWNPHHDEKGRFSSSDKTAYHATNLKGFAVALGAPTPKYAKPYYTDALIGNIKTTHAKLIALGQGSLGSEILANNHVTSSLLSTLHEPITASEDTAVKNAAKYKKYSETNLKKLVSTDYPKVHNDYMDKLNELGANHPLTKQANKKVQGWLVQAEMYGATHQQIADMKAKTALAYQMSPPVEHHKYHEAGLVSTSPNSESAAIKEYHDLTIQYHEANFTHGPNKPETEKAVGEAIEAQKHLTTKFGYTNGELHDIASAAYKAYLTKSGVSVPKVSVAPPKPTAPKYTSTTTKDATLALNATLGAHYYKLKDTLGQTHSDTQAAHAEWAKTKLDLTTHHGYSSASIGSLSAGIKEKYNTDKAAAAKESMGTTMAHLGAITAEAKKSFGAKTTPNLEALMAKAQDAGVPVSSIMAAISNGHEHAKKLAADEKAGYSSEVKSAASKMYTAISTHGAKSKEASLASISLDAAIAHAGKSLSAPEIKSLKKDGLAHSENMLKSKSVLQDIAGSNASHDSLTFVQMLPGSGSTMLNNADTTTKAWGLLQAKHRDAMSNAERESVVNYTGSAFADLNRAIGAHGQALFNNQNSMLPEHTKEYGTSLDSAFANSTLGANLQLTRVMRAKWFEEQVGVTLEHVDPKSLEGRVYIEHAYSSTTIKSESSGYSAGGKVQLNIRAPATASGMYVAPISQHRQEQEVVLPRGATYIVRSYDKQNNILHVDLVGTFSKEL